MFVKIERLMVRELRRKYRRNSASSRLGSGLRSLGPGEELSRSARVSGVILGEETLRALDIFGGFPGGCKVTDLTDLIFEGA
jgi:hypothetical protein